MEFVGFVVGLSGLIAVFDKACEVWRAIGETKDFGRDVDGSIRKLEIEFFRFHSWWKAVVKLKLRSPTVDWNPTYSDSPVVAYLPDSTQNPILTAAQSILSALSDIECSLRDSGVLLVLEQHSQENPAKRQRTGEAQHTSTLHQVKEADVVRNGLSHQLLRAIPWRTRVKYDATPWRESQKEYLKKRIADIRYWNDSLYSILPSDVKDSILWQGVSSFVLADPEEVAPLSRLGEGVMRQQAKLFEANRKLAENDTLSSALPDDLRQRLKGLDAFDMSNVADDDAFSLVRYKHGQEEPVLIEWYDLPRSIGASVELRSIALERLAKLSILLSHENKPSTLFAVDSIGCVESNHLHRFGLVSRVPDGFATSALPVSLYSLLCRKPLPNTSSRAVLPTLSQRFSLATTLTSSLYTFMLARWHHKMFNSTNIVFMFPSTGSNIPDLGRPFVCGYSLSRPSDEKEISICGTQAALSEFYLHPNLRVPAYERPKYQLKYEIYSLGLLLAEIGFWQPIAKIGSASSPRHGAVSAEGFKAVVTSKCASDLACWMGEQYRDITLRCLQVGDSASSRPLEDLTTFYWNIVLELVHCAERVKVFKSI